LISTFVNAKVVPLLSHTVTVTGEISKKAGIMVITADDAKNVK